MSASTGLIITSDRVGRDRVLLFQAVTSKRQESIVITDKVRDGIGELRARLPERLRRLHDATCADSDQTPASFWSGLNLALFRFNNAVNDFMSNLIHENSGFSRLNQVLTDAMPFDGNVRVDPPHIRVVMPRADIDLLSLPIELLPIMPVAPGPKDDAEIRDRAGLERFLLRFPAFAAVVTRQIQQKFDARTAIARDADNKIPTKLIRNHSFYSAPGSPNTTRSDVLWLKTRPDLAVEPEWPDDDITLVPAVMRLSRSLYDPRVTFNGVARGYLDQIQHFTCHYTQDLSGVASLGLRAQEGGAEKLDIELTDLSGALVQLIRDDGELSEEFAGPLIFLNACGSGGGNPSGSLSLIETLLLRTPARAIIVTETPVDFAYAGPFARKVYEELLISGEPLGMAMHRARWSLVDVESRPFGIFYSLYGNPDLRVIFP